MSSITEYFCDICAKQTAGTGGQQVGQEPVAPSSIDRRVAKHEGDSYNIIFTARFYQEVEVQPRTYEANELDICYKCAREYMKFHVEGF